ncbi:hypothetical protein BDV23DRAFT_155948, partial [Aspergillus alliaceus]
MIKCPRPFFSSGLNCSRAFELAVQWPTYTAYWHDTLGKYEINNIFPQRYCEIAACVDGRTLVYGQRAYLCLARSENFLSR